MNRKIELAGDILAEILNYILAASIQIVLFFDFLGQWPGNLKVACLVLVPMLYYLVRRFCGNAFLFFLLHFLIVAGTTVLYAGRSSEKAVFGIFSVIFGFMSISRKLKDGPDGMNAVFPPAAAGIFFIIYMIDSLQAGGVCGGSLMQLAVVYMIFWFLFFYLRRFEGYMDINHRTTEHIPVERAFYASFGLAAGFVGISAVIICLLSDRQLADRIAAGILGIIGKAIAFFFSLFPEGEAMADNKLGAIDRGGIFPFAAENTEPSFWVRIMDGLLYFFTVILIPAVLGAAVIGLVRLLKSAFGKRGQSSGPENAGGDDKVESLIRQKGKKTKEKKESFPLLGRTPDQIVRRQYMKTLYRRYGVLKEEKTGKLILQGTARECCIKLFPDNREEAIEFAGLYEKARYSAQTCDREDVRQMKRLSALLLK